ncbi:MAG: JAB domain-containing protein [Polyangiaceae bacterium]
MTRPHDLAPVATAIDSDATCAYAHTLLPPPPSATERGEGGDEPPECGHVYAPLRTARATSNDPPLPGWLRLVREPSAYASGVFDAGRVRDHHDAARRLAPRLAREDVEVMVVLALDGRSHVLGAHEVARGGAHGLCVTAREIYRVAVALGASAIILAHNHPSGVPEPSQADDDTTAAVSLAGDLLGIPLLDHLVVATEHRWVSYAATGRLDRLIA